MKILFVGQLKPLKDGIADHNSNYIDELRKDERIEITCLHNQKKVSEIKGVKYVKFSIKKYKKLTNEFDLIHFQFGASYHGDFVNLVFLLTPKDKKIVSTIHDFSNFNPSKYYRIIKENIKNIPYSIYNVSIKKILNKSNRVIVYSNFFKEKLIKKYPEFKKKIIVILHGVEYNKVAFKKESKDRVFKICSFGGITPRKGYEEVIEAIIKLQKSGIHLTYDIYGYSPFKFYINKLKNKIKNFEIKIKSPLKEEEIITTLKSYDLIIIPRKKTNEGGSGSLTFSLSSTTPVLSSNLGSFREYILDNQTGFIANHNVAAYFEKIDEIIKNKEKLALIRKNIQKWVKENISWRIICKKHVNKVYLHD